MKKRMISAVLALSLLLTLLPAEALAAELGDFAGTVPTGPQGNPEDPVYQIGYDTDISEPDAQISLYTDEETITCTLDNGAVITVTRTGTITNGIPGNDGEIIILEEILIEGSDAGEIIAVTSIGDWAFSHNHSLKSITIPNSVTSIGVGAFDTCFGLTTITIPDSITSIGDHTFSWCNMLTSITIPDSVTSAVTC